MLLDFQQQEPSFDPEWANKYLGQYLSSDSDGLYCDICDVQFSSLHNKQQHCLSRKHNEQVVKFVLKSIRSRQKGNQGKNNKTNNVVSRGSSSSSQNTDNYASNADPVSIMEEYVSNAEDHVSNITDHMSDTEDHVSSNEKDHVTIEKDHVTATTTTATTITPKQPTTVMDHDTNIDSANNPLTNHEDTNVVNLTHDVGNPSDHTTSGVSLLDSSTDVDHVMINDSDNNNIGNQCTGSPQQNVVMEKSLDSTSISFPPHCSISDVMHDFTLHQQGTFVISIYLYCVIVL